MTKKISIIGSGFAGLSAAAWLAREGHAVDVFEKNEQSGGRASTFKTDNGFLFDMGPSWYWMPDVMEKFFNEFGKSASDFYELKQLDPGFTVVFGSNDYLSIPADFSALVTLFEKTERGAGEKLLQFMKEAEYKYEVGLKELAYSPGLSVTEFFRKDVMSALFRIQLFSSFSGHVRKFFRDPRLISIMEFPVLFLGATPQKTPALYSLMNYAGLKLGTFYPMGGFGKVSNAMQQIAEAQGAKFHFNAAVEKINSHNNKVNSIDTKYGNTTADLLLGAADYHHVESLLEDSGKKNYEEKYWTKKTFAPACLLFFVGTNTKINQLSHHTLFFDADFEEHSKDIYSRNKWPDEPLFYVCCPSKTDAGVAPPGHENIFMLMPLAPGIEDSEAQREKYFHIMLRRMEKYCGQPIEKNIVYKKSFCVNDFKVRYNAYKGNAYGLANTLRQTAVLKPKLRNKRLSNLFYAGQLTVPGPGVPPAIISGQLAAGEMKKYINAL